MNSRRELAWLILTAIALYCIAIFLLGRIAFAYGYKREAHSLLLLVSYVQPMLILPCFAIALLPWRWSTLPLWLVCLSICLFPYFTPANLKGLMGYRTNGFDFRAVKEIAMILVIPIVTQFALWLKSQEVSSKPTS